MADQLVTLLRRGPSRPSCEPAPSATRHSAPPTASRSMGVTTTAHQPTHGKSVPAGTQWIPGASAAGRAPCHSGTLHAHSRRWRDRRRPPAGDRPARQDRVSCQLGWREDHQFPAGRSAAARSGAWPPEVEWPLGGARYTRRCGDRCGDNRRGAYLDRLAESRWFRCHKEPRGDL